MRIGQYIELLFPCSLCSMDRIPWEVLDLIEDDELEWWRETLDRTVSDDIRYIQASPGEGPMI